MCLLHTRLQCFFRIDHRLRVHDGFEPRLHLQIKLIVAISQPDGLHSLHPPQAAAARSHPSKRIRESARAGAGKRQPRARFQSDIAARTAAHPGKSSATDLAPKDIPQFPASTAGRNHPAATNIQSRRGRKIACRISSLLKTRPDVRAANFTRKRSLARAGKSSHQNNHKKGIVTDLQRKMLFRR